MKVGITKRYNFRLLDTLAFFLIISDILSISPWASLENKDEKKMFFMTQKKKYIFS